MTDDAIKLVARAMCCGSHCSAKGHFFPTDCWAMRDHDDEARAAIAALKASGWRKIGPDEMVVPREPTGKMIDAGVDVSYHQSVSRIYRAMIAAKDE